MVVRFDQIFGGKIRIIRRSSTFVNTSNEELHMLSGTEVCKYSCEIRNAEKRIFGSKINYDAAEIGPKSKSSTHPSSIPCEI